MLTIIFEACWKFYKVSVLCYAGLYAIKLLNQDIFKQKTIFSAIKKTVIWRSLDGVVLVGRFIHPTRIFLWLD